MMRSLLKIAPALEWFLHTTEVFIFCLNWVDFNSIYYLAKWNHHSDIIRFSWYCSQRSSDTENWVKIWPHIKLFQLFVCGQRRGFITCTLLCEADNFFFLYFSSGHLQKILRLEHVVFVCRFQNKRNLTAFVVKRKTKQNKTTEEASGGGEHEPLLHVSAGTYSC